MLDAERQNPSCPLCGGGEYKPIFEMNRHTLVQCQQCELFFINPYPKSDEEAYQRSLSDNPKGDKSIDSASKYRGEVLFYQTYYPLIANECRGAKSILDIGCGSGYLLERLKEFPNLKRVGIELSEERTKWAQKVAECEILPVPIEDFKTADKFDVITIVNVFGFIRSLDDLFAALRNILNKDGRLILKVGELHSNVQKNDAYSWDLPDHKHFLGLTTIDYICKKYRFQKLIHQRRPYADELFSPEKWKAPGRSGFRNKIKRIVSSIPFALPLISRWYRLQHGERVLTSFVVLTPLQ
ncbi:MAG: class I SAM-dependent methyltransferase [bacterium]|nr:class I SAM-dependent methyltransferase [bacterium]